MPISHKHKVIFIHIPKTGGSSVAQALGVYGWDNYGSQIDGDKILFGEGYSHLTASEIKEKVEYYDEYFKFTIFRNPYEKVTSNYRFDVWNSNFEGTFKEFVNEIDIKRPHQRPQINYFDDEVYVGLFENINEEIKKIGEQIGVELVLPHINHTNVEGRHYLDYYDRETLGLIEEIYKEDLEYYNGKCKADRIFNRECGAGKRYDRVIQENIQYV